MFSNANCKFPVEVNKKRHFLQETLPKIGLSKPIYLYHKNSIVILMMLCALTINGFNSVHFLSGYML